MTRFEIEVTGPLSYIFEMGRPTNFKLSVWSTMTSITDMRGELNLKALSGCSSHHLQGAGA